MTHDLGPVAPATQPSEPLARPARDGLAVAAFVTGLLALGPIPLVLGVLGLRRTSRNGTKGRGLAIAGIILGATVVALLAAGLTLARLGIGTTVTPASPSQVRDTYQPADPNLSRGVVAASADLFRARLLGTGAVVAIVGRSITVDVPTEPAQPLLSQLAAPNPVEVRQVLVVADAAQVSAQPAAADAPDSSPPDPASAVTPTLLAQLAGLDCTKPLTSPDVSPPPPDTAVVACASDGTAKYVLGPVEVSGDSITSVDARVKGSQWVLDVTFDPDGTAAHAALTQRLAGMSAPLNRTAIWANGRVVLAPQVNGAISTSTAEISAGGQQAGSELLAAQLGFGRGGTTWTVKSARP